jgi:hypothetical protein
MKNATLPAGNLAPSQDDFMFNLEQTIAEWRQQMNSSGIKAREVLEELESHLREDVEGRVQSGTREQEAFEAAVHQLGQAGALTSEFAKIGETNEAFTGLKRFLLTLAGIQNPIPATNMNTSSSNGNPEPAWATYLKSGAFALPAAFLWLFITFMCFPKFNEIMLRSGLRPFRLGPFGPCWDLALFLKHYLFTFFSAFALTLALLEWRVEKWPRYRRITCNAGVFLLNSLVLVALTALVVQALVAASHVVPHVK